MVRLVLLKSKRAAFSVLGLLHYNFLKRTKKQSYKDLIKTNALLLHPKIDLLVTRCMKLCMKPRLFESTPQVTVALRGCNLKEKAGGYG